MRVTTSERIWRLQVDYAHFRPVPRRNRCQLHGHCARRAARGRLLRQFYRLMRPICIGVAAFFTSTLFAALAHRNTTRESGSFVVARSENETREMTSLRMNFDATRKNNAPRTQRNASE